jgi:hypothetical protein
MSLGPSLERSRLEQTVEAIKFHSKKVSQYNLSYIKITQFHESMVFQNAFVFVDFQFEVKT